MNETHLIFGVVLIAGFLIVFLVLFYLDENA
jgi:hypothetical protein